MIIDPSNALAAPGSSRGYARLSVADGSIAASATRPPRRGSGRLPRPARGIGVPSPSGGERRRLRRGWGSGAVAPPSPQVQTPTASVPLRRSAPRPPHPGRERGGSRPLRRVRRSLPGTPPSALARGRRRLPPREVAGDPPASRRGRVSRVGSGVPACVAGRVGFGARPLRAAVCGVPVAARAPAPRPRPPVRPPAGSRLPTAPLVSAVSPPRALAPRAASGPVSASPRRRSSRTATSDRTWRPAEFKHISQRRKRN